ncbi:MAG: carboxymuconolactone decarboxylase family protein [Chitinophagales bacterium]|nr:carboxymuconolactone decarboxylase family protein [Chitinophagales bacterium]
MRHWTITNTLTVLNLAHEILLGPSPLSSGERELIASYVSYLNECEFCHYSHSAAASEHFGDKGKTVQCVIDNIDSSNLSEKMKQLLRIASKVQKSGRQGYCSKKCVKSKNLIFVLK